MMELLERFNPWWKGSFAFPGIPRNKYLSRLADLKTLKDVVLISGLRRTGKTTLMRQLIHGLIGSGTDPRRILYVSLDNIGLAGTNIIEIESTYRRSIDIADGEPLYLFLDEVHFQPRFELQLKNLYDLGGTKVFASGSANLEIMMKTPFLTGRYRSINVKPLDFKEFLEFRGMKAGEIDSETLCTYAEEYARTGGIPEYVLSKDINSLNTMLQSVLYRDIFSRSGLRDRESLDNIFTMIVKNVSTPLSVRSISRVLKHSEQTVSNIIGMMEEAGLINKIEMYGKFKERKANPPKLYLADTGLFNLTPDGVRMGAIIENLAYLKLMDFGAVHYMRSHGKEIDFILNGNAYEVKYSDNLPNGIDKKEHMISWRGKKGLITRSIEGRMNGIRMLPIAKVLLAEKEGEMLN